MAQLEKKVAIVTGGASGFGEAIARTFIPVMRETALLEDFMGMPDTPENRNKFLASIPLGRLARPNDVANAALYLASDAAEFITGVEFPVDGGRTV